MTNSSSRVTFLLGAGASVDAGLPVSVDLTRVIAQRLEGDWSANPVAQALHVAIGAIVAHDTARGKSAYAGIDVERIFASIRMLARRSEHELTPFVSAWNGGLESIGTDGSLPGFWARNFRKEIYESGTFAHGLERTFREGVEAIAKTKDSARIYLRLEQEMIESLVSALAVSSDAVDYLSPLVDGFSSTPLRIATLNYDSSVELMADKRGLDLDTGIQNWIGGYDWHWRPEAQINLLKLHGSLDWRLSVEQIKGERIAVDRVLVGEDEENRSSWGTSMGVVFGQGSKLRADGPFLAMLIEFDRFLASTDKLIVVGYSMRDEHINAALRRWVSAHPEGKLTIVDPGFPSLEDYDDIPFRRQLVEAFCEMDGQSGQLSYPRTPTANITIVRKSAKDGLADALTESLPGL